MRRTTIRTTIVAAIFAIIAALVAVPLEAKKPTTSPAKGPKTTVGQAKGVKPVKPVKTTTAKGPSTSKGSAMKSAKATAPKGSSKKTSTTTTASTTTSGAGSTPTTTSETPVYTNDVAKKVSTKPVQLEKLAQALGVTVADLTTNVDLLNGATSGIKNFGQMNAMVNTVLNSPTPVEFADLKLLMTGMDMSGKQVEGQTIYSLGQAKQQLGIADDGDAPTTTTSSTTTTTTSKSKSKKRTNPGGTQ